MLGGTTQFEVEFDNGRARRRRGQPPPGFVDACDDIARLYNIRSGSVRGVGLRSARRLKFSRDVPERARQPIRNVWTPPPTGGSGNRRARG